MVKNFILSTCLFLISICSYSTIQGYNTDSLTYKQKATVAVAVGSSFEGIKEVGNNQGFSDKNFEKLMRNVGWFTGAAWCAFSLKLIYTLSDIKTTITGWSPSAYNKNNVVFTDGKSLQKIQPGDAGTLSYNKYKNSKSRYKGIGHAFLIEKQYGSSAVVTLEGNTDADGSREGNGFHRKIRPLQSNLHITRWEKKK